MMIPVKFVEDWRGNRAGDEVELEPEVAEELAAAGVVESEVPAAAIATAAQPVTLNTGPLTDGGSSVEYQAGEQLAAADRRIDELTDLLKQRAAEIAALRTQLAALAGADSEAATTLAEAPAGDVPTAEAPAADEPAAQDPAPVAAPIATPVPTTEATDAPPAPSAEAWRDAPTASLDIPNGVKARLMDAGLLTAGAVADAVHSGEVIAVDGIGEGKAEQLAEHLAALRAGG